MESSFQRPGFFSEVIRVWDLIIGQNGVFGMDTHVLEAWKPNVVMEQNLMESSFQRPGIFSEVLRGWDLSFVQDRAFEMDIHLLEAGKPNVVMEPP